MPGEDFFSSIKKAKTMSLLKLVVSKEDIKDDFMMFAGRNDIDDEVEICLRRPKGTKRFPENLIQAYFDNSQNKTSGKIKKITIKGTSSCKIPHSNAYCSDSVIIFFIYQYRQFRKGYIDFFWIRRYTNKYCSNFNFFFCSDHYNFGFCGQ